MHSPAGSLETQCLWLQRRLSTESMPPNLAHRPTVPAFPVFPGTIPEAAATINQMSPHDLSVNFNFPSNSVSLTDSYGGPAGPFSIGWNLNCTNSMDSTNVVPRSNYTLNTFPSHCPINPSKPLQQGPPQHFTNLPNVSTMPCRPIQRVFTVSGNGPVGSANGMAGPAHQTKRPYFPVTKKPRGNNTWAQMEYERYLNGVRPTSPVIT